jgi:hypothetical protein
MKILDVRLIHYQSKSEVLTFFQMKNWLNQVYIYVLDNSIPILPGTERYHV